MNTKTKNVLIILAIAGIAGVILNVGYHAAVAEANVLGDLWSTYVAPWNPLGSKPIATGTVGTQPVELYKPVLDYEKAVIAAVKKAMPATVAITVSKNVPVYEDCAVQPFFNLPPGFQDLFEQNFQISQRCAKGTKLQEVGGGSGFIISSDGLILTNKHVVTDTKASYTVLMNDGKKYDAKILARDQVQDLAVVKIDAAGLPTVELGDSDSIELGQTAIAIGNALAQFRNTVSVGAISGLARNVSASGGGISEDIQGVIQTDAAINPGNSGGPLLNLAGQVIGINTAIVSDAQSIGFAIPINQAKRDITSIKTTGEIQAAYLGVRYITVTPEIKEKQKLSVDHGALVRGGDDGPAVMPNSPASKAGVMAEDVIVAVNGKQIGDELGLGSAIGRYNVGDTVTVKVNRGGKDIELKVTLEKRPE